MIKHGNTVILSKRLQAIADMIPGGGVLADVGCDHGFLDIYLVQTGKIAGAIAMDVRKGPLAAATTHVREAKLEDKIETRLSDGLEAFQAGEANVFVCAGMGGPLMQRILTAYPEKTESFQDFLLQPQSEIKEFRAFLRENGYKIIKERIVWEDGKYYFPMLVRRGMAESGVACCGEETAGEAEAMARDELTEVYDQYGKGILEGGDPLTWQYLLGQKNLLETILKKLQTEEGNGERRQQRIKEMEREWKILGKAMEIVKGSSESGEGCLR